MKLKWTTDAPTQPGWYWTTWLKGPHPSPMRIISRGNQLVADEPFDNYVALEKIRDDMLWFGPFTPPPLP